MRTELIKTANASAEAFLDRLDATASATLCLGDIGIMKIDPSTAREWVRLTRTYIEVANRLLDENEGLALRATFAEGTRDAAMNAFNVLERASVLEFMAWRRARRMKKEKA